MWGDHEGLARGQLGPWECGWPSGTMNIMSGHGRWGNHGELWGVVGDLGAMRDLGMSWRTIGASLGPWG